tara:strand:+ start:684 stop:1490 length:807 start_codon:yes stop_codon:yes gene_type:complete
MIKITKKALFDPKLNRMKMIGDVDNAINEFNKKKNKNLNYLLKNRFSWMKEFISKNDKGLEVGAGGGFSKKYILNKNFKISDLALHEHLDFKNLDAQNTQHDSNSYDFVIAVNMIHHVPYPVKFLNEMYRILKPGGKLIIQEAYCSIIFQIITIIMRHEGFDFTKDVWNDKIPLSDQNDRWSGNIAVPHLIFDDRENFDKKIGNKFKIKHEKFYECLIFLNSGGVTSKTFYIPLSNFLLKFFDLIDSFLVKFFPKIFAMGRQIVLEKV